MNSKIFQYFTVFLLSFLFLVINIDAKDKESKKLNKTLGSPSYTRLNINNTSTYIYNNGNSDIDPIGNSGLYFPKGTGKTAMFESGLVWGAKYKGEIRVGGSAYRQGLQSGRILPNGDPEDPNASNVRIFRVRPDYKTGNVQTEVKEESASEDAVRNQYEKDWNEWPAADGAPFDDVDKDGTYNPAIDIPGVPGASQTIWYVANDFDASNTVYMYGSNPLGVEMQATFWAYAQAGPLGNMFFRKYTLINKSDEAFSDMYVSMWADPDLGDASDDFAGCDTTLSLGYVYNANPTDATYGDTPPPACGFDFFQGPIVPGAASDSAIFKGRRIHGKKNLPMTAFYYFARGDANVTDPTQGSYEGTLQFYNFMQGRIGKTGQLFSTPEGVPTTFALSGDPVAGTGWIDGALIGPGDRRMGSASGPFTMAVGDTQEIVVAELCAGGNDRLQSVSLLKNYDKKAQEAYDSFFKVPTGATPPKVSATALDRKIVLSWGNPEDAAKTEGYDLNGFKFQGYNVYQLPKESSSFSSTDEKDKPVLIATYDLVDSVGVIYDYVFNARTGKPELTPVQSGGNLGIKRSIIIDRDYANANIPLHNGTRYYFAVTSYSYNPAPDAIPNMLENPISPITVVPQTENPGVRYSGISGDTLKTVSHASGTADGKVIPIVVDPAKLTGHTYKVTFANDTVIGATVWNLTDVNTNKIVAAKQTNQSGDANYYIIDGVQVVVTGPEPGMKKGSDGYKITGRREWTSLGGTAWLGAEGFDPSGTGNGTIGNAYEHWFSGSTVTTDKLPNVKLVYAATDSLGNLVNPDDPNASFGYRYMRRAGNDAAKPEFAPFIVNKGNGDNSDYPFQDYKKGSVPFAAYNVETNQRLMVGFMENNVAAGMVDGKWWPPSSSVQGDNAVTREAFFIFNVPYSEELNPSLAVDILNETTPMLYLGYPIQRAWYAFQAGDEFEIISNKINTPADVFTFTTPAATNDVELAKKDIGKVNVFPNPYYGLNSQEINKYERFVTFSHLPREAKIRIFNLAGTLVRTIDKASDSQFQRWDLANESGLPVASGLFIVHIDMPGLGTKILKVAIIQEQQVLDRF